SLFHRVEHSLDVSAGNFLVKKIAHRIHEDHSRALPYKRLQEPLGPKREVESGLKRMPRHAAKPLGKSSGIAVVATRTDLRAPGHRVPRRVSPFDCAVFRHGSPQIRAMILHAIFRKEKP